MDSKHAGPSLSDRQVPVAGLYLLAYETACGQTLEHEGNSEARVTWMRSQAVSGLAIPV